MAVFVVKWFLEVSRQETGDRRQGFATLTAVSSQQPAASSQQSAVSSQQSARTEGAYRSALGGISRFRLVKAYRYRIYSVISLCEADILVVSGQCLAVLKGATSYEI